LRDFRLTPQYKLYLLSFWNYMQIMLVKFTDVLGQPIGPIIKIQAAQNAGLMKMTDRLFQKVGA
jgi:hypothetical protein